MKREKLALAAVLLCWAGIAAAQQSSATTESQSATTQSSTQGQQDPVAAAARRARERKEQKQDQSKTAKVWDNENIPTKPDSITVIGESGSVNATTDQGNSETSAATPAAASDATSQDAKSAEADAKEKAAISSQISQAKEHLQSLNTDLDLLTRKNALDQQMYYNKPDYASDKQGGTNLKDEQDQIDAKKQEIAEEQKKIEELTSKLNEKPAVDNKPATNPQ